jgi:hypothetical protein
MMAAINKQYCFNYRVTNEVSKFNDRFCSQYGNYSDAMDELIEHIIGIMGTGFRFIDLKISVLYG